VRTHCYRITVSGSLSDVGREAFGEFRIEANGFELLELTRMADGNSATPK
jgi:hypothetical protein